MKQIFRKDDALILFTFGTTSNKKIAEPKEKVVQTFSFSRGQLQASLNSSGMGDFFSHDKPVCGDCPFAVNNGAKLTACYTHKFGQYRGFLSSLRAIARSYKSFDDIPELDETMESIIVGQSAGRYVRFGSYGEPTLIPIDLVKRICNVAKSWTGYTHQWMRKPEYADYLMASTHGAADTLMAETSGWRCFASTHEAMDTMTHCPASKESEFKSNCSRCGLCSGTKGKGKKSVNIILH
jgi:hypothetical protein